MIEKLNFKKKDNEYEIRMLVEEDLPMIISMVNQKLEFTNIPKYVFSDGADDLVFKYFVLSEDVVGYDRMRCFGYFENQKLISIIGIRNQDLSPSWVLSFIVTDVNCINSLSVIKSLLNYVINYQESKGMYQWFVISKLDKFKSWQKIFYRVRLKYHHYIYGRILANTLPKWLSLLQVTGNKLYPYDVNISMYISKKLCTSDNEEFDENDHTFI